MLPGDEAVILPGDYSDTAGDLDGDDDGNPGEEHFVQPRAGYQSQPETDTGSPAVTFWLAAACALTASTSRTARAGHEGGP